MHENMVDVLIYLYENYLDGRRQPPSDQGALEEELSKVGFSAEEIEKALHWLDALASGIKSRPHSPYTTGSMRIYSASEIETLDSEVRGLLLSLEQRGILDPESRELVIDRILAFDHSPISQEEIKWVVLLVLMNRPGCEDAFHQMEELIYNTQPVLH